MAYNINRYIGNFLDPFFDDSSSFFDDINSESFGSMPMKTDIRELDDRYVMEIDLPGFNKDNIKASLKDGYLTITANVSRSIKPEGGKKHNFVHRERFSGSVTRSYYVAICARKTSRRRIRTASSPSSCRSRKPRRNPTPKPSRLSRHKERSQGISSATFSFTS